MNHFVASSAKQKKYDSISILKMFYWRWFFLSCWSTVFEAVKDVYMLVWSQLSKISTAHVNHGRVLYRVSSFSQPDSLIPFTFNAYFTTKYIASVWEVILNIYLNVDPGNKGLSNQLLFTCSHTILMKNLNGKQNLRPEKDICSCLVKFYCTIDTVYAEYTWIISCISLVSLCLLCNDSCWDSAIANDIILTTMHVGRW